MGLWQSWMPCTELRPYGVGKVAPGDSRSFGRAAASSESPPRLGWAGLTPGAVCLPRIESYSCKMAGDDKHMFKQFCQEGQPHVLEALSPPQTTGISPSRYHGPGVFLCRAPHQRQQRGCGWGVGIHEGNDPSSVAGLISVALGWLLCLFIE